MKQLKNKERGKVMMTKDTKKYILSSTSANTKDESTRMLKERYFEKEGKREPVENRVLKQGFMSKKGNFWNKSFKKRYFKLLDNKQLVYYKQYDHQLEAASDERGMADLNTVRKMVKKGSNGWEVTTPSREWKFMCSTTADRDAWYGTVERLCMVEAV